jgi:hypothetical protein
MNTLGHFSIANWRLPIELPIATSPKPIGNWQSEIGNVA